MTTDLTKLRLTSSVLPPPASWAEGLEISAPTDLAKAIQSGIASLGDPAFARMASRCAHEMRERAAYTTQKPASSRLPINYQRVPGPLRRLIASCIGRVQRLRQNHWARYPTFPLDLTADVLADLSGERGITFDRTPVMLSHDIDTAEGLSNLQRFFLPLEEKYGARSVNYVVPCGWPIDHGIMKEVLDRGHELGIHGYNHANLTPFANECERQARLNAAAPLIQRYGIKGYRAPSLLRTTELLKDLGELYAYDSSIPTSGGAFPVPNNGCASARPWKMDGLWELPLTMPRDGSLRFLGYSPEAIADLWISLAQTISQSGGIVFLLNHCEAGFSGNPAMLKTYEKFLSFVAQDKRFEMTTPTQLLGRI